MQTADPDAGQILTDAMTATQNIVGTITAVRGPVVEARFAPGELPPVNSALTIALEPGEPVMLEVHSHLDARTVRAIALQPTAGLARGMDVVHDRPADHRAGRRRGARSAARRHRHGARRRARAAGRHAAARIHGAPPALSAEAGMTTLFETGIKVIDLLAPLAQGGKAAMFGGAGVGKTVLVMELIHAMVEKYQGHLGLRRRRRALARGP